MQTSATAPSNSATDIDAAGIELTPKVLKRRRLNRRNMLIAAGLSYLFDAALFGLYAWVGTTTFATPIVYGICGMTFTAVFLLLSETGFNDRFSDHYLTIAQSFCSSTIILGGIYFAPEVGFAFCAIIFIAFGFSTLRSSSRQAGILWTYATVCLTVVLLMTDRPIDMPTETWAERVITLLFIVTVLGRVMSMGLFAVSMREMLYRRGKELKAAYERIEELAQLDELTGALNRRFVMKELDEELMRCMRTHQPCSVALIDLDWFKKINDTFGHPAGDEALRTFAITMFANIRVIDKFGRYGGEEFLLIMPDTPQGAAIRTVDRLREIVAGLDWAAISPSMTVTISAGITSLRANDTSDSILARADQALYQAKESGRNRVLAAA
jgi:diguanylate cyclase (GGDEF)-like protein